MNRDQIKAFALANGFKLKPQIGGPEDLNDYVYKFAEAIIAGIATGIRIDDQVVAHHPKDCPAVVVNWMKNHVSIKYLTNPGKGVTVETQHHEIRLDPRRSALCDKCGFQIDLPNPDTSYFECPKCDMLDGMILSKDLKVNDLVTVNCEHPYIAEIVSIDKDNATIKVAHGQGKGATTIAPLKVLDRRSPLGIWIDNQEI